MKKILVLAVISIFLMIPRASFAKIAISDNDLAAITGQATVTIDMSKRWALPNLTNLSIIWEDEDGFSGYENPGYFGTTDFTITGETTGFGKGEDGLLTLDITFDNGVTVIKTKTPEIIIGGTNGMNIDMTLKVGSDNTLSGTQRFGHLYVGGIKATMPPSEMTVTVYSSSSNLYGTGLFFAQ